MYTEARIELRPRAESDEGGKVQAVIKSRRSGSGRERPPACLPVGPVCVPLELVSSLAYVRLPRLPLEER